MQYDIVSLPKDQWKGAAIPLTTRSDSYYDLELSPFDNEGCVVTLVRKPAETSRHHFGDAILQYKRYRILSSPGV